LADVRMSVTGETFSRLKKSIFGWKVARPNRSVFEMLRSSWLIRSPNSVLGGMSGTEREATVMPGSTNAPTTHPREAEFPGQLV
jgi:hypothetical protein